MSPLAVENGSLVTSGGSLCETCCDAPPETGACCYTQDGTNWICEDGITAEQCAAKPNVGVNFYPNKTCGEIDCPEWGVCCLPPDHPTLPNSCEAVPNREECEVGYGGTFYPGAACGDPGIPCGSGVCCLPDGSCIDGEFEDQCVNFRGGVFFQGQTCDGFDCSSTEPCVWPAPYTETENNDGDNTGHLWEKYRSLSYQSPANLDFYAWNPGYPAALPAGWRWVREDLNAISWVEGKEGYTTSLTFKVIVLENGVFADRTDEAVTGLPVEQLVCGVGDDTVMIPNALAQEWCYETTDLTTCQTTSLTYEQCWSETPHIPGGIYPKTDWDNYPCGSGSCCFFDDITQAYACTDGVTADWCAGRTEGVFYDSDDCSTIVCPTPNTGACCGIGDCYDDVTEDWCMNEYPGSDPVWYEGQPCTATPCSVRRNPLP
jgi:hypothetical protein